MFNMKNNIEIVWTGEDPCLCYGEWVLFINGEDYSNLIPFQGTPAYTYGEYRKWHFEDWDEVFEYYFNGLKRREWIKENMSWLSKLPLHRYEYSLVYELFHKSDWRPGSCGGCI